MIAVMGATGHTGRVVAEALVASGAGVRALGRSAGRLASLAALGAETAAGDATDGAFLAAAFRNAEAVYAMVPPDMAGPDPLAHYDRVGAAIERGVRDSGVRKVVFLSSLGGQHPAGTGPVVGLHRQEERLKRISGIDLLILRPTYFMENLFGSIPTIKAMGINGGAVAPDVTFPMIATRDIGLAAAAALRSRTFTGVTVQELLGPRDVSMREVTAVVGRAIGKPDLAYVQFPDADYEAALTGAGVPPKLAALFVELAHAINTGMVTAVAGRTPANTTSTTVEEFAADFAAAYQRA